MKFALASVLTIAAFIQGAIAQAGLVVNTPANVVVCQPILITWNGGTPPYFLSILPGNQPTAAALIDFGQQNGTSLTWKVNVAAGTSLGLTLRDSKGLVAQSAPFTVNAGTDIACIGQPLSTSAGAAAPPPATSAAAPPPAASGAPTTAPPGSTNTGALATSTRPTSASASTSRAASSTPASAASSTRLSQMGVAGAFGAAVLAILA